MKTILTAVIIMTASMTYASDDICGKYSELSESIMSARQAGVPAVKMIETQIETDNVAFFNLYKELVIEAYEWPRYSFEDLQQESINDFKNKIYIECLKANR